MKVSGAGPADRPRTWSGRLVLDFGGPPLIGDRLRLQALVSGLLVSAQCGTWHRVRASFSRDLAGSPLVFLSAAARPVFGTQTPSPTVSSKLLYFPFVSVLIGCRCIFSLSHTRGLYHGFCSFTPPAVSNFSDFTSPL